jgi:hypothetical protein
MANSKISALTSATTPLAGTETLPVVQSGATKQVSVANLTAGRAVATGALTVTGTISSTGTATVTGNSVNVYATSGASSINVGNTGVAANNFININGAGASNTYYYQLGNAPVLGTSTVFGSTLNIGSDGTSTQFTSQNFYTSGTLKVTLDSGGNIIPAVAAKGINFTANTPAAGMTSQLLNWYEQGTWTPTQGAGLTVIGTFSSQGTYTRVGRVVTVTAQLAGSTSVATAGGGVDICAGLPFAAGTTSLGTAIGIWTAPTGAAIISTTIYASSAISAVSTILISATYQV